MFLFFRSIQCRGTPHPPETRLHPSWVDGRHLLHSSIFFRQPSNQQQRSNVHYTHRHLINEWTLHVSHDIFFLLANIFERRGQHIISRLHHHLSRCCVKNLINFYHCGAFSSFSICFGSFVLFIQ